MSATGARLDALAARARAALSLSVGDARVERTIPAHDWWTTADALMPHGYVHSPGRHGDTADGGQEIRSFDAAVWLVVDGTQEEALGFLEAFESQVRSDPTLGGLATGAHVSEADLIEMPGTTRRLCSLVVSWVEES